MPVKDNYPSINGSLIFIMISVRPDICMPVGRLSRAMHNPSKRDAVMCVDVLSYVKRTRRMKLVYRRSGNAIEQVYKQLAKTNNQLFSLATNDKKALMPLGGFSDSNHAPACDPEFRSTSGYTMFVLFCLVSWKSKLQSITAQSTHEAELIALTLAANEAVWIRDLLITLGFTLIGHTVVRPKGSETCIELGARKPPEDTSPADDMVEEFVSGDHDATLPKDDAKYTMPPIPLGNDNASANFAATNPTTTFRNRWIATRYYSVRNHVRNLHLLPTPVPTSLNVADLFTKAIPEFSTFDKHRRACGLIDYEDGA